MSIFEQPLSVALLDYGSNTGADVSRTLAQQAEDLRRARSDLAWATDAARKCSNRARAIAKAAATLQANEVFVCKHEVQDRVDGLHAAATDNRVYARVSRENLQHAMDALIATVLHRF